MREAIRRVRFAPYRRGMGPRFTLTLWEAPSNASHREMLGYRLRMVGEGKPARTLFEGEDFGCSPLHATDSDEAVEAIMGFLTLRPGDTDPEYFAGYTAEQADYCAQHAEALGLEVYCRFGEGRDRSHG